ncbi:hypothetical protein [Arcanobacterium bovis]|uniref:Uncharacterized protein n=1 Tax=Arcanobacterium bovis TaxID=2529275 RepID=A0A4Q9V2L0_9ACTO|nr:hypothetical protein [Arcanobacterium bovis]TBW23838.1 hypothetical protein EZJ44_01515 [Arcanobacterium bovis]
MPKQEILRKLLLGIAIAAYFNAVIIACSFAKGLDFSEATQTYFPAMISFGILGLVIPFLPHKSTSQKKYLPVMFGVASGLVLLLIAWAVLL